MYRYQSSFAHVSICCYTSRVLAYILAILSTEHSPFFGVRLLSVLLGHAFFSSPLQRPMTSDFKGLIIPDFIHFIYFPVLILEKDPVFPFWIFSAKQGHYWYYFHNVFGITRSLTAGLNPGPPALEASTLPLGYRGGGPWLGIEPGTSCTRSQHSTTRLSRRRSPPIIMGLSKFI